MKIGSTICVVLLTVISRVQAQSPPAPESPVTNKPAATEQQRAAAMEFGQWLEKGGAVKLRTTAGDQVHPAWNRYSPAGSCVPGVGDEPSEPNVANKVADVSKGGGSTKGNPCGPKPPVGPVNPCPKVGICPSGVGLDGGVYDPSELSLRLEMLRSEFAADSEVEAEKPQAKPSRIPASVPTRTDVRDR